MAETPTTVDEYIAAFEPEVQVVLKETRRIILDTLTDAQEKISWGMATYVYGGKNAVHFAGHKRHMGLYPGVNAIVAFAGDLAPYKTSKGGIQFPYDQPLPQQLIRELTAFSGQENIRLKEGK